MEATRSDAPRSGVGAWVLVGAVTGVLAGAVFIFFEMVVAKSMGMEAAGPLRMIAAIVLGREALPEQATVGLPAAEAAGFVVHFVLSAVFGAIFGAIAGSVGVLRTNRWVLLGAAVVFGLALWIVNFYVIGSIFFPWFTTTSPSCNSSPTGSSTAAYSGYYWKGQRAKRRARNEGLRPVEGGQVGRRLVDSPHRPDPLLPDPRALQGGNLGSPAVPVQHRGGTRGGGQH